MFKLFSFSPTNPLALYGRYRHCMARHLIFGRHLEVLDPVGGSRVPVGLGGARLRTNQGLVGLFLLLLLVVVGESEAVELLLAGHDTFGVDVEAGDSRHRLDEFVELFVGDGVVEEGYHRSC